MNLGEIKAECGRLLNDPNNDRWSGETITGRANQIQTEIQALTNAIKTENPLTPTEGQSAVTIDSSAMNVVRVRITNSSGEIKPLVGKTQEELDFLFSNWKQWDNGEPEYWYLDATLGTVNLVPPPNSSYAISSGLSVWEVRKPTDLSDDTDVPFDSNDGMIPFHMTIVHGVVALCWMDDGTPEALAKASFHRSNNMERPGQFENQLKIIKSTFDAPTNFQSRIMTRPQGGRLGRWSKPSKAYPFSW